MTETSLSYKRNDRRQNGVTLRRRAGQRYATNEYPKLTDCLNTTVKNKFKHERQTLESKAVSNGTTSKNMNSWPRIYTFRTMKTDMRQYNEEKKKFTVNIKDSNG